MKKKHLLAVVLSVILILSNNLATYAMEETKDNYSPEEFVLEQIAIIGRNDVSCPWSEETEIVDKIVLFDLQHIPNGYVFKLETDDVESGFIQVHDTSGIYSVYCYAFEGDSEVECMMNYWNINEDSIPYIYFLGSFQYLIDGNEGEYINLATNDNVMCDKNQLQTMEVEYLNKIKENPLIITEDTIQSTFDVVEQQKGRAGFTWPIMSDFTDITIVVNNETYPVTDHCTPTAATAILKYLNYLGWSDCSEGQSTRETFAKMYVALNTNECRFDDWFNSGGGTARSQIAPGIRWYASQNNYTITADKALLNTLSGMKSHLDNNQLLLVSVDDFGGYSGGHSIVVTGYSSNTLYIQNGWSRTRVTYSYSSLNIAQYVYVGA